MAERTMTKVRRGLDSESSAESLRRIESAGCLAAASARIEDASRGSWAPSGEEGVGLLEAKAAERAEASAFCLAACLRRCGNGSAVAVAAAVAGEDVSEVACDEEVEPSWVEVAAGGDVTAAAPMFRALVRNWMPPNLSSSVFDRK